ALRLPPDRERHAYSQRWCEGSAGRRRPRPSGPLQEFHDQGLLETGLPWAAVAEEQLRSRHGYGAAVRGGGQICVEQPGAEGACRRLGRVGVFADRRSLVVTCRERPP